MINPLAELGAWFLSRTVAAVSETLSVGEIFSRSLSSVGGTGRGSLGRIARATASQIYATGVQGLPTAGLLSILAGLALGKFVEFQSLYALLNPLVELLARSVAPLLALLVIVIRSPVAVASDLGRLRQSGELGPPERLDREAFQRIVLPRLIGILVGTAGLCCVSAALATLATTSVLAGHPSVAGLDYLRIVAPATGLQVALLGSVYGLTVALIALHHGLHMGADSTAVPGAASRAMVKSIVLCSLFTGLLPLVRG